MNLNTAAMLCDHFVKTVADGGLAESLSSIILQGKRALDSTAEETISSDMRREIGALASQARAHLSRSVFEDPAMQVFAEFEQLGFLGIMTDPARDALDMLEKGNVSSRTDLVKALAEIAKETKQIDELTDQVRQLLSVASYFGVEKRDVFAADAIAVIQMPRDDAGSQDDVNAFIFRIQSFQRIAEACDDNRNADHNIRMISGRDPLMVADMTKSGADRLQKLINAARMVQADLTEIAAAEKHLEKVGVRSEILQALSDEREAFRRFEADGAHDLIKTVFDTGHGDKAREIAQIVLALVEGGARLDSVVLSDFDRKHEMQDDKTPAERVTSFLPSDLGGASAQSVTSENDLNAMTSVPDAETEVALQATRSQTGQTPYEAELTRISEAAEPDAPAQDMPCPADMDEGDEKSVMPREHDIDQAKPGDGAVGDAGFRSIWDTIANR